MQFVINPTFDSSITSDPNAATIEATIQSAINVYEADIHNNVTVKITFSEMRPGLGESSKPAYYVDYGGFLGQLKSQATTYNNTTLTAAITHLPQNDAAYEAAFGTSTTHGTADGQIVVTQAEARMLGYGGIPTGSDGTISLNTSEMNISRTGAQDPSKYDLVSVVSHEIDEILGLGSGLNQNPSVPWAEDLYLILGARRPELHNRLQRSLVFLPRRRQY